MNKIGVTGYSGTLNGRATTGIFARSTIRLMPVHKKKNQNTGAVKSTIDSNPFRVNAPKMISKVAIIPCNMSEFTGADFFPFHFPRNENRLKSFPSA